MITNSLLKQTLLRQSLFSSSRYFSTLNASTLDQAISKGREGHQDWKGFFSEIKPSDIASSDIKSVGKLLKALTYASHSEVSSEHKALFDEINEYFRKRFRNLSTQDALEILVPLGEDTTCKLSSMDDKFWFWETVEEAVRPHIDALND